MQASDLFIRARYSLHISKILNYDEVRKYLLWCAPFVSSKVKTKKLWDFPGGES